MIVLDIFFSFSRYKKETRIGISFSLLILSVSIFSHPSPTSPINCPTLSTSQNDLASKHETAFRNQMAPEFTDTDGNTLGHYQWIEYLC